MRFFQSDLSGGMEQLEHKLVFFQTNSIDCMRHVFLYATSIGSFSGAGSLVDAFWASFPQSAEPLPPSLLKSIPAEAPSSARVLCTLYVPLNTVSQKTRGYQRDARENARRRTFLWDPKALKCAAAAVRDRS